MSTFNYEKIMSRRFRRGITPEEVNNLVNSKTNNLKCEDIEVGNNDWLNYAYKVLNRVYFNNELPYVDCEWSTRMKVTGGQCEAYRVIGSDGCVSCVPYKVKIATFIGERSPEKVYEVFNLSISAINKGP